MPAKNNPSKEPLKIFYAAGPGDVIGTYRFWKQMQQDPALLGLTDSGQFYDLVMELGAKAMVVASCPRIDKVEEEPFTIKHIPKEKGTGLLYHLYHIGYGLRICYEALRFKSDVAVIEEGTSHWFIFNLLHFFGIAIIPSLKCVLWPQFLPLSPKQKILNFCNRTFFRKKTLAILTMSSVISDQINKLAGSNPPPLFPFFPVYMKSTFTDIPPPNIKTRPFSILYIGRMEEFKGIFDLLEIAKKFKAMNLEDIHFHFCGNGSATSQFENKIQSEELSATCHYHGYCEREKLKTLLGTAHVVIAPTRTSFVEGFCMVVVEGVLAKRPVITSVVCPALETVRPAALEANPDNSESYAMAILSLYRNPDLYQEKQAACLQVGEQFYVMTHSWQAALDRGVALLSNRTGR